MTDEEMREAARRLVDTFRPLSPEEIADVTVLLRSHRLRRAA